MRVICCSVRILFFVTFESLTVIETSFVSQIVLSFSMYFDLYKFMSETHLDGGIHQKSEKSHVKSQNAWRAKKTHFHYRHVRYREIRELINVEFKRFRKRFNNNRFENRFLFCSVSFLDDLEISNCRRNIFFFSYSFRL